MQLLAHLEDHAARRPAAMAVRAFGPCAQIPLSYARLWEMARSLAAVLAKQLPADGTVMLPCANRPEFFVAYLGTLAAGRTVFPVHPRLTATELRAAAAAANVQIVIGEAPALEAMNGAGLELMPVASLHDLPLRSPAGFPAGRPGLLLQSSGTTGLPKIVYRDGPSLDAVASNVARATGLTPEDRVLGAVPLGHSYGMENALLAPVWSGACTHLCDGLDVPVVTALIRGPHGATVFPGGAFMFEVLGRLEDPGRSSLRLAYSAGSPLPAPVAQAFADRFELSLGQLYGASEVGSVTFNDPGPMGAAPAGFDPSSAGMPMGGVQLAILDAEAPDSRQPLAPGKHGHVAIHAPSALTAYIGQTESPFVTINGASYFPTGDLGHVDNRGRLWIAGRIKLLIDVGGVKVNPLEVEQVLAQHPEVGRCVVVAVPVSPTVSRIKAILTPRDPATPIDVDSVRRFARERLAGHKMPRVFEARETLPLSPAGKVLRWQLAAEAGSA